MRSLRRIAPSLTLLLMIWSSAGQACTAVDWLTIPLPSGDAMETALETAYPGSDLDRLAGVFTAPDGTSVAFETARDVSPADRLNAATIGDMFVYPYPLDFDLTSRRTPWMDPGRVRNDAFLRAIWFGNRRSAEASLTTVSYQRDTKRVGFRMTTKNCVHAQLAAALAEIAGLGAGMDRYFDNVGGSFNWRTISGTDRLSAHSFGIAVDFNSQLGGYWIWSGAKAGQATNYANTYPEDLVQAMERHGFIWGGKWHHFDGMHFEYRPELILFARLAKQP